MLLLTTLAAVGTWWYLRPEPLERQLPGGMKLRVPIVVEENKDTRDKVSKYHGPFVVLDRYGRTLAKGFYDNGWPAGFWTYYHQDGRKALAGPCVDGCRAGVWTAWDESGRKRAEVEHGEPVSAISGKSTRFGGGFGGVPNVAVRQGAASEWWDNGQPRTQGSFQRDRGHGSWTFWNRDGEKTADGEFLDGVRHGLWTIAGEKGQQPRESQFVRGREVPRLEKLLPELERQLQSDGDCGFARAFGSFLWFRKSDADNVGQ
jgi:antitoxin component YwqK of YwqJK toxin-antitoxin module